MIVIIGDFLFLDIVFKFIGIPHARWITSYDWEKLTIAL